MSWVTELFGERECEMNLPEIRGLARPRANFKTKKIYTVPADAVSKETIADLYKAACGDSYKDWDDEVHLRVDYQRPYPKSKAKYKEGEPDLEKPDVDNVLKLVMDALIGVAYKDDNYVTDAHVKKHRRFRRKQSYMRIKVTYISNVAVREPRKRKADR